jgi:hypothetical protein
VYLFNGATGALISTLRGSSAFNQVGSGGVTALTNGHYVVHSPRWDNGGPADVGAVTWGNGATGVKDRRSELVAAVRMRIDEFGEGCRLQCPGRQHPAANERREQSRSMELESHGALLRSRAGARKARRPPLPRPRGVARRSGCASWCASRGPELRECYTRAKIWRYRVEGPGQVDLSHQAGVRFPMAPLDRRTSRVPWPCGKVRSNQLIQRERLSR